MSFEIGERVRIVTQGEAADDRPFLQLHGGKSGKIVSFLGVNRHLPHGGFVDILVYDERSKQNIVVHPRLSHIKKYIEMPQELFEI